jgi:ribosomal protein S18 acetylase RimI-like enzyme
MDLSGFLGGGGAKKRGMDLSGFLGGGGTKKRGPSSPACSPTTTPAAAMDEQGGAKRRRPPSPTPPPGDGSVAAVLPRADQPTEMAAVAGTLQGGVVLRACADAADVDAVRMLNAGLLPLPCPERVYRNILGTAPRLCALGCVRSSVVGAITAVVETDRATKGPTGALYIMTLAVVAPRRRSGVGSALLSWLLGVVRSAPQLGHIDRVELHVHAGNSDALAFYEKAGFERIGIVERYYPRLEPPHAVRVRLRLRAERCSGSGDTADTP